MSHDYPQMISIEPPLSKQDGKWQLHRVHFRDSNGKEWFGDLTSKDVKKRTLEYHLNVKYKVPKNLLKDLYEFGYCAGQQDEMESNAGPEL